MAELLKGAPAAAALIEKAKTECEGLRAKGVVPTLAILRVGENAGDISYEKGACKKAEAAGVEVKKVLLPADVPQEEFDRALSGLNEDPSVHGILMFRPLPAHIDGEKARNMLSPDKDVDGCTDGSLAAVFTGSGRGFAPCTARAAVELLKYYGVDISGKKAAVIGRSLVVGRPVAMLLMSEGATVVNCHTKTPDTAAVCRAADILISAAGRLHCVNGTFTNPDQVVIDVGINWDEEKGKIAGDCDLGEDSPIKAISPVPGGVGAVTSAVLISHVVEAASKVVK